VDRHNFDILYGKEGELYYAKTPMTNRSLSRTEATRLFYSGGRTISITGYTPIYGFVSDSKTLLFFLIPLAKPIVNYTSLEL
jgi:hypothetical protein